MKTNSRLFLDIHAIQTLPPSNINRDDTGSPKTARYGGVMRARVSSQSWKKAMRDYFIINGEQQNVGVRTLRILDYVAENIRQIDGAITEQESIDMGRELLDKFIVRKKNNTVKNVFDFKENEIFTKYMVFFSKYQARELAKAAINKSMDTESLKKLFNEFPSIDIALFGRMVAEDPSLNEDASAQVAHAISTHAVQSEFDYFTAIDDLSPENNAGAGMIGTIEFNSSTLYRYANVAVHELLKQLQDKEATINTLKLFIEAFSNSMPTGKVNTFANQTYPQALVVTLRNDRPISLVSAFEKPVRSANGYVDKSIEKLFAEFEKVDKFVNKPLETMFVVNSDVVDAKRFGTEKESLNQLLSDISQKISELVDEE